MTGLDELIGRTAILGRIIVVATGLNRFARILDRDAPASAIANTWIRIMCAPKRIQSLTEYWPLASRRPKPFACRLRSFPGRLVLGTEQVLEFVADELDLVRWPEVTANAYRQFERNGCLQNRSPKSRVPLPAFLGPLFTAYKSAQIILS
jgi:hypothetical protein